MPRLVTNKHTREVQPRKQLEDKQRARALDGGDGGATEGMVSRKLGVSLSIRKAHSICSVQTRDAEVDFCGRHGGKMPSELSRMRGSRVLQCPSQLLLPQKATLGRERSFKSYGWKEF